MLARTGRVAPLTMTDGAVVLPRPWSEGANPADDLDRIVLAVRAASYPQHGLAP